MFGNIYGPGSTSNPDDFIPLEKAASEAKIERSLSSIDKEKAISFKETLVVRSAISALQGLLSDPSLDDASKKAITDLIQRAQRGQPLTDTDEALISALAHSHSRFTPQVAVALRGVVQAMKEAVAEAAQQSIFQFKEEAEQVQGDLTTSVIPDSSRKKDDPESIRIKKQEEKKEGSRKVE